MRAASTRPNTIATAQAQQHKRGKPDYLHPSSADWGVATPFAVPQPKRDHVVLSDAQGGPRHIADIEIQKPRKPIGLCGLLVVGNMHLGYHHGGGGWRCVAIRRAGNQSRTVSFATNGHFLTQTGIPDSGGGGGEVWHLADSTQPHSYRITDPGVLAILTDRAHFRSRTAWEAPEYPELEAQYGEGE